MKFNWILVRSFCDIHSFKIEWRLTQKGQGTMSAKSKSFHYWDELSSDACMMTLVMWSPKTRSLLLHGIHGSCSLSVLWSAKDVDLSVNANSLDLSIWRHRDAGFSDVRMGHDVFGALVIHCFSWTLVRRAACASGTVSEQHTFAPGRDFDRFSVENASSYSSVLTIMSSLLLSKSTDLLSVIHWLRRRLFTSIHFVHLRDKLELSAHWVSWHQLEEHDYRENRAPLWLRVSPFASVSWSGIDVTDESDTHVWSKGFSRQDWIVRMSG